MATITDPQARQLALEAGTYGVPDLAALMQCSEKHIRWKAEANEIPGMIRFGRLIRFSKRIVNDWLANVPR